jgi:NAD(P)H-hydrate epimerase
MEVLTSAHMDMADKLTINEIGIPSIVLMENAARAVFEVFTKLDNIKKDKIAIFVGKGNNGGDGLALSRYLIQGGFDVDIYLLSEEAGLKGDSLINFNILKSYPARFNILKEESEINLTIYDVIFDAIFGSGFKGIVQGFVNKVIDNINRCKAIKIAIDIPSGLSADTYTGAGNHIIADYTVTFCRPKIVHCLYPVRHYCGQTIVADISIPDYAVEQQHTNMFLLRSENLPIIKKRRPDAHKGTFGHAVIIGGSQGKTGAAIMASLSCARTGAGLTTCVIPGGLYDIIGSNLVEIMSHPVSQNTFFNEGDMSDVAGFLEDKTVAAIGPGLGRSEETVKFVRRLLKEVKNKVVIDADAIFALDIDTLKHLSLRAILTPHIGEFARLLELDIEQVLSNRIELAMEFANRYNIYLILKSADTLIVSPEGNILINVTGSPSLSKGGSGDCLTGLITGFLSQGYSFTDAASLSVFIMGRTAEILAHRYNENTILTRDIIDNIWTTFNEISFYQQQCQGHKTYSSVTI